VKILDVPQSGSQAGTTSSRNRFGQYRRTRAIPVNTNTAAQQAVRARLESHGAAWRAITQAQRAGWIALGLQIQRTDSLGQVYNLTGFQAYASVNGNLLASGEVRIAEAPALSLPDSLLTLAVTTTGGTMSVAYTATPLAADTHLMIFAGPQRSAGRGFENDLRLIATTAAAAASPHNLLAAYSAKFGAPVVGNRIFVSASTVLNGFQSLQIATSVIVVA